MQNLRLLPSSSWVRMNDFESDWISWSQSFEENGWIQDGRIQDGRIQDGRIQYGCHHQVKWEWMSLSQIELVWVRVRVERECFWVNLREDNKVSESKMAEAQSNMEEFMMAAIIKLSQNEQVKFFCAKWLNPRWQSSRWMQNLRLLPSSNWVRMNEWRFFFVQNGWIQNGRIQYHCHHQVESEWMSKVYFCEKWLNPRWLPSSSWVRMNDFESDWISWSQSFEENGWIQDGRFQNGRIQDERIQYGCHHQVNWEWMS